MGMEFWASGMPGKYSTTEPQLQLGFLFKEKLAKNGVFPPYIADSL